jgi:hypothetical protein
VAKRPPKKKATKRAVAREQARVAADIQQPDEDRFITADNLRDLLERLRRQQSRRTDAVSAIGSMVTDAIERQSLHRRAFKIFCQLDKLTDAELKSTLTHLTHYIDVTGMKARANAQGVLFSDNGVDNEPLFEEPAAAAQ